MPVLPSNLNTAETQSCALRPRPGIPPRRHYMDVSHALGTPVLSLITLLITYQRCGKVGHEYTHFTFQFNFK